MTTFLKLSSIIINTKYIQKIIIGPGQYYIKLMSNGISGGMFYFTSTSNEIKLCAIKDPTDYKILHDWLKELA